ncbi:MAG: hypothetical protein Kow0047_12150 [Anaerolineae bacterium]
MTLALLADLLTLARGVTALWLIWLGVARGADALPLAVMVTLGAWLTDMLDGPLGRRAGGNTRLGHYDFVIDVMLTWASLIYLTLSGFIPMAVTAIYTLIAGVLVVIFQRKAVMVLMMRPVDITCGVVVLTRAFEEGIVFTAVLAGVAWLNRRRLREGIPRWLRELGEIFGLSRRR